MNIESSKARLVLLCPAWKKWGTARTVKQNTVILHSRADDVVPFADSEELAQRSGAVLIEVGTSEESIEVSSTDLLFGSRRVEGALTGTPATGDATLKFSVLSGVAAMIETMPLEKAAEAYAKMLSGKARFRMVLSVDR